MRSILRLVTLLMLMWLPLQGYATAAMTLCAKEAREAAFAEAHDHHAGHPSTPAGDAAQDDTAGVPDCPRCSDCAGGFSVAADAAPASERLVAAEPGFALPAVAPHIPDLLQRPPRLRLA